MIATDDKKKSNCWIKENPVNPDNPLIRGFKFFKTPC